MQLCCETCITFWNLLKFICSFLLIRGGGGGEGLLQGGLRNTPANTWPFNLCEQPSKSKTFFMPRFKFMTSHRAHPSLNRLPPPRDETTPYGQSPLLLPASAQCLVWRAQFHIGFCLQRRVPKICLTNIWPIRNSAISARVFAVFV